MMIGSAFRTVKNSCEIHIKKHLYLSLSLSLHMCMRAWEFPLIQYFSQLVTYVYYASYVIITFYFVSASDTTFF